MPFEELGSLSHLGVVGNSSNVLSGRPVATHFIDASVRACVRARALAPASK